MKPKLIPILFFLLTGSLLWATYFLPVHSFEKAFRLGIDDNDMYGVYPSATIMYGFFAIIITALLLFLAPKWNQKLVFKIIVPLLYVFYFTSACTHIAWDYRAIYGVTWLYNEVFFELVKPKWYFYVFGILGLTFNYLFIAHTHTKSTKTVI